PGPEGVPAKPGEHLVSFELRGGVTAVSAQRGLTRGCAKTPASPGFMRLIQGQTPERCGQEVRRRTVSLHGPPSSLSLGGERGIRTLAGLAPPTALAKPPLQPLGYLSAPCCTGRFKAAQAI